MNQIFNVVPEAKFLPAEVIKLSNAMLLSGECSEDSGVFVVEAKVDMGDGEAIASVTVTKGSCSINVAFHGEYINLDLLHAEDGWHQSGNSTLSGVPYGADDLHRVLEEIESLAGELAA